MSRKLDVKLNTLTLTDNKIDQILDRVVTPFGNSAKASVPKKYIGKRVYVIVTK